VLELGTVRVRALHTPGHRPEHTAFLLTDTARGAEPWAVLTGDSLFVGDIARPDLAIEKADGAREIFHSLHDRLLSLPGDVEVWPGHLGGSMCGGPGMDLKVSSTVGYERAHNELLDESDEDRFVERAISGLGPQPPNFRNIVSMNRGPLVTDGVEVGPLTPRQVLRAAQDGALIIDARTDLQFDEAHIPGTVSIPMFRAGFGTRLAWLADHERDTILIGRDDEDARDAARLAVAVGVRRLGGYLSGGMTSWREERLPVARIERVAIDELAERLSAEEDMQVLDVRERAEHERGIIPGSLAVPWHELQEMPAGLHPDRPIAVVCASGQRAGIAASMVARLGATRVVHVVDGGVPRWKELGQPTASV
jgi:rhodanese-related sulfurtransferase